MSRRAETRLQSRRAASKEALKQLQLLSAYDDDDSTETYEITSDDDVRKSIACFRFCGGGGYCKNV